MREHPLQGVVLHAVLSTAITISGVPFALIDLGAAWVYRDTPAAAMAMLFFAKTLGSATCFAIARGLLSERRKAALLEDKTIKRVNNVLKQSPLYYGTLCRLATMPAAVKNYGLAILPDIEFPTFMACCMLGSLVGVPIQAVMGMQLGAVYLGVADANQQLQLSTEAAVGMLVGVVSLLLVLRLIVPALLGKDTDEIRLVVDGMKCGGCQEGVKRALESVKGVTSATVDLGRGSAVVLGSAPVESLIQAVAAMGKGAKLAQSVPGDDAGRASLAKSKTT
jgi:copper chaperone